ncbi:MAG: phage holin family protein [Bacteroidetes bacterium]|nr:MAG: phage holin family protein [Bacteroidota bacterium]
MGFLFRILVIAVNAFVLAYLLPGVEIDNFFTAIVVALLLAFLDFTVKPLLIILTLPVTFITLGLFLFIVNALIILIDAYFVHGFKVDGLWYAVLYSFCLSIANSMVLRHAKRRRQQSE